MAESFVGLPNDGPGKKLRSFSQTIGGQVVEHQGIVICDSAGNERSVWPVNDNGGSLTVDTPQLPSSLVNTRLPVEVGNTTAIPVSAPATAPVRTQDSPLNEVLSSFRAVNVTAVTTEGLLNLIANRGGGADAGAATSVTPTAGKSFRVLGLSLIVRNVTTATVVPVEIYLRYSTGVLSATSPILYMTGAANPSATIGTIGYNNIEFGGGFDIPSGVNFGVSHISRNTVNAVVSVVITGYEFTP